MQSEGVHLIDDSNTLSFFEQFEKFEKAALEEPVSN
jgi:hypothetical protein